MKFGGAIGLAYLRGMITLRDNQIEPIRKAIDFFRQKKSVPSLIVLPTAWGKSILTAYVAKYTDDRILIVQPSKELLEQNYMKYVTLCGREGVDAAIYSASVGQKKIGKITYATIGSIKKLGKEFKELGFTKMLIDEAHLYPREADSMLGQFLKDSEIKHVLGITATPIKLQTGSDINGDAESKLVMLTTRSKKGNFFKDIIHVGQVQEMVEMGYWSPLLYESEVFDDSELIYNSAKSEFTEESIERAYEANDIHGGIEKALGKHGDRQHVLVFLPSVQEAKDLSAMTPNSACVYGDMPKKERAQTIKAFREGQIRTVFNVGVLTTGFDYPKIDMIVLARSTASMALYYQIVGRGSRIDPEKKDCLIVDLAGNVERFGHVEDIFFKKDTKWRMYGTGGKLISDTPIHLLGKITMDDIDKKYDIDKAEMPFGKHKGELIKNIPVGYRRWMLEKFDWTDKNSWLKRVLVSLEKRSANGEVCVSK